MGLISWLAKIAADTVAKKQSSQSHKFKVQHGKPNPLPHLAGNSSVQPAQRYGIKMQRSTTE